MAKPEWAWDIPSQQTLCIAGEGGGGFYIVAHRHLLDRVEVDKALKTGLE